MPSDTERENLRVTTVRRSQSLGILAACESKGWTPAISICIPTYNRAKVLRETMKSVLDQDFQDFELVVVDDGSTDETESIVTEMAQPQLVYYRNHINIGMVGNWNRCLEVARAEIVWVLHDDDFMAPGALSHVVSIYDTRKIGLLFGKHDYVAGSRALGGVSSASADIIREWSSGEDALRAVTGHHFSCVSVSIRKEVFRHLGGFDNAFPYSADEEYWPRIAQRYRVASTSRVLVYRRLHAGNYMVRTWQYADFYANFCKLHCRVAGYISSAGAPEDLVLQVRDRPYRAIIDVIVPTLLRHGETAVARRYLRLYRTEGTGHLWQARNRRALIFTIISWLPSRIVQQLIMTYRAVRARMVSHNPTTVGVRLTAEE